ncbi:MAG TPA: DEAD/DEAH box helicase, partial [Pseudomonas sp.]|nr:DEAD/DEAH box helicase [Pseudomonas sp.]
MTQEIGGFAALGIHPSVLAAVVAVGYEEPSAIQSQAIPVILGGHDMIGQAQTGTGKTAAFALPILSNIDVKKTAPQALVLAPTRELAIQVAEAFQSYAAHIKGFHVLPIYGGQSYGPQLSSLRRGVHVVVGTPGRVIDHIEKGSLDLSQLTTLVLDEADRMLDLGFARELDGLMKLLPKKRQTLLFSATFSDQIRALSNQMLRDPVRIEATPRNTTVAAVKQWIIPVDKKRKPELFVHLLKRHDWTQVLAFARTRKGVDELVSLLEAKRITADSIHGDKPQPARLRALERFKAGEVRVLVATDVAAR